MKYAFDILTQVQFKHSYFADGVFNGLSVNMSVQTQKAFNNLGLLYKPFNGGFYILYDTVFAGQQRDRAAILAEKLIIEFTLELQDPLFYNYTSGLPQRIDTSVYYFRNALTVKPGEPNPLHKADIAGPADVVNLSDSRHHFFKKPFARLSLLLHAGLEMQYYVAFNARKTFWRYILMNDYLHHLTHPAIVDETDGNVFGDMFEIDLPGQKKAYGFVSASQLTLSQYPAKYYRLVENYKTGTTDHKDVIRALPYPDVRYLSNIPVKGTNPANYSDIFIH